MGYNIKQHPSDSLQHLEKIENPPKNDAAMTRARLLPLFFSRAAPSYSRSLYSRRRELSSRLRRTAKPPNRRTLKFHNPGVYASVLLHQLIIRDGRQVERQRNHEGSAATIGLFNVNPALMLLDNRSHNGQTQTRTAGFTRT